MSQVSCPSCGEKGNIPDQALGKKLRCQKCGKSFVAGGGAPSTASFPAFPVEPTGGPAIEVDGLEPANWSATAEPPPPMPEQPGPSPGFAAADQGGEPAGGPARQYKVLTQKDRWFEGKFDLSRLEDALNHYARQGWVVRSMATPHVTGFSGGPREELVILLER